MEVVAIGAIAAVASSAYYTNKAASDQRKATKSANAAANKSYQIEKQQTEETLAEQRRKNSNVLKQQLSGYKARLGAAGLSSTSGSGSELLRNTEKEHDMDDKYLESQAQLSLAALQNSIAQTNSRNLLALSSISNQQRSDQVSSLNSAFGITARSMLK